MEELLLWMVYIEDVHQEKKYSICYTHLNHTKAIWM